MEKQDTTTDYQTFVRVWDQKGKIVEITIAIIFFFFLLEIRIHYFLYREFSSPISKKFPLSMIRGGGGQVAGGQTM